ncbi:MAG TPA: Wadjet anti-phage system protein JetD domain-containing protein [Kofleriaceae bacterium]|nr:Wadjet anti-phage system protein JetD domain-containing protein [Kofleriaceae bacterium]
MSSAEPSVRRIRALCAAAPGLTELLGELLDRRERRGALPSSATLVAGTDQVRALSELLSPRAVKAGDGRVRIDLRHADEVCRRQLGLALDELLYAALDRTPRDPAAERARLRSTLAVALAEVRGRARTDAARRFVDAELGGCDRGSGETHAHATTAGVDAACLEVERIARCMDAALENDAPIRIANFAAAVLGDSKALAAGSDRARRLARALIDHHEPTRDAVYLGNGVSDRQALRQALEVCGVHRDEAALTVYCFGPLVYEKAGRRFDQVAAHAVLGDPVPLSLAQLRGAAIAELPVRRALVIENQTPFLDYVEALAGRGDPDELVVFSHGQASWAVIQLLRMVRRARVPIVHTGDLDRSGVLIARSLGARLFGPVATAAMDTATFERFRHRGQPLSEPERARLAELVTRDPPGSPGAELLAAILDAGVWIEQERFFAEAVMGDLAHRRPSDSSPV